MSVACRSALAQRGRLVAALVAIFRNQDQEEALGVDWETDEYLRLHRDYYALADQAPWWVRLGVWRQALRRYQRSTRRGQQA